MKRTVLCIVISIMLLAVTACTEEQVSLPSEEFLRATVPETAEIYLPEHLPLILTERTLSEELGEIPQNFVLDETMWEKLPEDNGWNMETYYPAGKSQGSDCVFIYEYGRTELNTAEYTACYTDGTLTDVFFSNSDQQIYLYEDNWSFCFNAGTYSYIINYTYQNELTEAYVSSNGNGFDFSYENGTISGIYYFHAISEDGYSETLEAHYREDGTLDSISYYHDLSHEFFYVGPGYVAAEYDGNYQLTDTNLPGGAEAYAEEEKETPAPTQEPSAEEHPLPGKPSLWESFINNDPVFWDQIKELF